MTRLRRPPLQCFLLVMAFNLCGNQIAAQDLTAAIRELADKLQLSLSPETAVRLVTDEAGALAADMSQVKTLLPIELTKRGLRVAGVPETAAPAVRLVISRAITGRLLIAEAPGAGETEVIIVPYSPGRSPTAASRRVLLAKSLLWRQSEPILDGGVERGDLWILSPTTLVSCKLDDGSWKQSARWTLEGAAASRDPRGRLVAVGELPVALLPGLECSVHEEGSGRLTCRPSSRGWPIARDGAALVFAKPGLNYFERLESRGAPVDVPPFFSAAPVSSSGGERWAMACLDGVTRLLDASITSLSAEWGSDLLSRSPGRDCPPCLIATLSRDGGREGLQAFDVAAGSVLPVSDVLELEGSVSALWAAGGASATLVVKEKDSYAAWLLDISCAD